MMTRKQHRQSQWHTALARYNAAMDKLPKEPMSTPFIDTNQLPVVERRPGWHGRTFDSPSMTFAHYDFEAGSSIHEHSHPQEEVWQIIAGELEITVAGVTRRLGPGFVAVVPPNTLHSVKAIISGKAIIVDYPLRESLAR